MKLFLPQLRSLGALRTRIFYLLLTLVDITRTATIQPYVGIESMPILIERSPQGKDGSLRFLSSQLALDGWEGSLCFAVSDEESSRLACQLHQQGVTINTAVGLYFVKSIWYAVAVVAVLKAGGAFVLIDLD